MKVRGEEIGTILFVSAVRGSTRIALLVCLVLLLVSVHIPNATAQTQIMLVATKNAYVDSLNPNTPEDWRRNGLQVANESSQAPQPPHASIVLLQFDIASLQGKKIVSANLQLVVWRGCCGNMQIVVDIGSGDFDEGTVTWNTMLGMSSGPPIAWVTLSGSMIGGPPVLIPITGALQQSLQAGSKFVTFTIYADNQNSTTHQTYAFVNREDTYGNAPQLVVKAPASSTGEHSQEDLVSNGNFANGLANWTEGVLNSGSFSGYPHFGTEVDPSVGFTSAYIDVPGGAFAYLDSNLFYLPTIGTLSLTMWGHKDPVILGVQVVVQGGPTYVLASFDPPKTQLGQNPVTKQYPLLNNVAGQTIAIRLACRSEPQYATGTFCDYANVVVTSGSAPLITPQNVTSNSVNISSASSHTKGVTPLIQTLQLPPSGFGLGTLIVVAGLTSAYVIYSRRTRNRKKTIAKLSDTNAENLMIGYEFIPDTSPNDSMRVLESIRGGEGHVFVCANKRGEKFALKTFRYLEDPFDHRKMEKRFYNEAALWVGLGRHPNIVRAISFGKMSDSPYLLLEFVEGGNLRQPISDRRIDTQRALGIARDVSSGLMYSHSQGVVHGDIKPENVLLDRNGRAKVTDFGVSRLSGVTGNVTLSTEAIGTLAYMSPEQLFSEGEIDERSDIYSFGILLYEMLTFRNPLRSETLTEAVAVRRRNRLAPPSSLQKGIPHEIDRLVMACMRRQPEERPHHFGEVLAVLEKYARLT
jgi:hypothetical protein